MPKGRGNLNYTSKNFTGEHHWSECIDWKFITVGGARVQTIFNIPFDELQAQGISRVETEEYIQIFAQRLEFEPYRENKTKVNYNNYQIIQLDFDYLLEWQSRFFMCLGWNEEAICRFLQDKTTEYIAQRTTYLKRKETERIAQELAESLGSTPELVMAQLFAGTMPMPQVTQETQPKNDQDNLLGRLKRLGNEYFLSVDGESEDGKPDLYKVASSMLIEFLDGSWATNLQEYVNCEFVFQVDTEQKPPKSRGAKGWVKSLVTIMDMPVGKQS